MRCNTNVFWDGDGTLNITNGGNTTTTSNVVIADYDGSRGIVNVDGAGSVLQLQTLTSDKTIIVGLYGDGTLNITNGGVVSSEGSCNIGGLGGNPLWETTGTANVHGTNSHLTTTKDIYLGSSLHGIIHGVGTLNIADGGKVTTQESVYIEAESMLDLQVVSNVATLDVGDYLDNDGTVRLAAGTGLAAGVYSPIVANSWSGAGSYQAFGGVWNATAHEFTVPLAQQASSGVPVPLDLATAPRVDVDSGTGQQVSASFSGGAGSVDFSASLFDIETVADLSLQVEVGEYLAGWDFNTSQPIGQPVLLSFYLGAGYEASDLQIWHLDNQDQWSPYIPTDLTIVDGWASFTVDSFSGYGLTTPEPSTFTLAVLGLLSMLGFSRRRQRRRRPAPCQ